MGFLPFPASQTNASSFSQITYSSCALQGEEPWRGSYTTIMNFHTWKEEDKGTGLSAFAILARCLRRLVGRFAWSESHFGSSSDLLKLDKRQLRLPCFRRISARPGHTIYETIGSSQYFDTELEIIQSGNTNLLPVESKQDAFHSVNICFVWSTWGLTSTMRQAVWICKPVPSWNWLISSCRTISATTRDLHPSRLPRIRIVVVVVPALLYTWCMYSYRGCCILR